MFIVSLPVVFVVSMSELYTHYRQPSRTMAILCGIWWKVFSGSLVASPAVAIQLLRVTVSLPTLGKSWDLYSVALPFDFRIAKVK